MTRTDADVAVVEVPLAEYLPAPTGRRSLLGALTGDRAAIGGTVLLLMIVGAVLAAPWLAPADPGQLQVENAFASPSLEHPLGTDVLGRDIASRLLYGGRTSLAMALAATAGIVLIGLTLGIVSGMLGGAVDAVVMRTADVVLALPGLIVAMVALAVLGKGPVNLVFIVILFGWPGFARVARATTLTTREQPFVEAARALGASKPRIMARHILPNLVAPVTVVTTLDLGRILLALSALSFLGFGVDIHQPEWGAMLAEARTYFRSEPQLLVYPGVAISLVVFAVNLCGDGLRDVLDRRGKL